MADTLLTSTELLKINDMNLGPQVVSDLLQDAPFIAALAAVPASNGTQHKYLKHTTAPSVGFRALNAGIDYTEGEDTAVTVDLKIMSANVRFDYQAGVAFNGGLEALMDRQGARALRTAFAAAETELIYSADSGGFGGLLDIATINQTGDSMVVNAGGSTALTSVYLVRSSPDDVALVLGNDGNITVGETMTQLISGSNSKLMPIAYRVQEAWMGLQVGSIYTVARICNIDDGSNTLTDDRIAQALALFPASRGPTMIVMNRRSRRQLQDSRTATNSTGAPAPFPTEAFGVPIIVTDAVTNSETAVTS